MNTIATALVPVIATIVLGWGLWRQQFVADAFWGQLDRLNYWVLFPCLLFNNLISARLQDLPAFEIAIVIWGAQFLCANSGAAFTSVFQGGVRFNTYIALATVPVLFGNEGRVLIAILIALFVPMTNVLCVTALAYYAQGRTLHPRALLRPIASNPLIISCVLGAGFSGLNVAVPDGIRATLTVLSQASLACGLISVGAALRFEQIRGDVQAMMAAHGFKFIAMPLLSLLLCQILGINGFTRTIIVFFNCIPTASTAQALARQMGGDVPLMSRIITTQTLVAFVYMPLVYLGF
jgi:malonate transporter and related proteins